MQNRKWILTSLVITFFGIPILAQFLAAVIAMLGVGLAGIIEVCNIFITPTIYLLLNIFMLALGALMLFFSGRVWADDSAPEKREIAVWRQCLFLVPALLTLGVWIIALHLADYQFRQMGAGWLADLMLPWLGVLLASLVGGEYWWLVIIPVGGNDQEIQTWQRPEDSGSQTVMQSQVMKNVRMISPQETEVASMMEGMIKVVAEYRNTNNAIGYTFRYYATQMNADKNIKLLAINGIAPTAENIRNGKYPYIVDAFMVTRENMTSETQKLVEWFLTPQGQSLVEDVGYVPMYKTLH